MKDEDFIKVEKGIRCKCGKIWGMRNLQNQCKRCGTSVIARGLKPIKKKKL